MNYCRKLAYEIYKGKQVTQRKTLCTTNVASPSRRDAGFTIQLNDGNNKSLYFMDFIIKLTTHKRKENATQNPR